MSSEQQLLRQIETMSYYTALSLTRHEPIGSQWFQGKVGDAMMARMAQLKKTVSQEDQVAISKRIGW